MQICRSIFLLQGQIDKLPAGHADRSTLEVQRDHARMHQDKATAQKEEVSALVADPPPRTAVCQLDFGMIDLQAPTGATEAQRKAALVNVLTGVICRLRNVGVVRRYVDLVTPLFEGDEDDNDFFFLRAGSTHLFEQTNELEDIDELILITDGCAKQFASVFFEWVCSAAHAPVLVALLDSLPAFAQLCAYLQDAYHVKVRHIRKASYHGACLADAHFAHLARAFLQAFNAYHGALYRLQRLSPAERAKLPKEARTVPEPPPRGAVELAAFVNKNFKNTTMYVVPSIDRSPSLKPPLETLKLGIKSYHDFTYPQGADSVWALPTSRSPASQGKLEYFRYKKRVLPKRGGGAGKGGATKDKKDKDSKRGKKRKYGGDASDDMDYSLGDD
jgi:hypothetical protein